MGLASESLASTEGWVNAQGLPRPRELPMWLRESQKLHSVHVADCSQTMRDFLGATTAFVGKDPAKAKMAKDFISHVNSTAEEGLAKIQSYRKEIPDQRRAIDEAMNARMSQLAPLCSKYMFARAELQGLSAAQCMAAQGRLNAEQLTDEGGPPGCVDTRKVKSGGDPSLPSKVCTWGYSSHNLKCYTRLGYLEDREAAPGTDPKEGLPMDDWVRRWCHPKFSLPARPLSADLAAGQHVNNEEAEVEAEALKPEGDNGTDKVPPDVEDATEE